MKYKDWSKVKFSARNYNKKRDNDTTITIRIKQSLKNKLKRAAAKRGISYAKVLREKIGEL
jgi:predicted DNA binding CopG/RHH family protein